MNQQQSNTPAKDSKGLVVDDLSNITPIPHAEFETYFAMLFFAEPFLAKMSIYIERVPDKKCKTAYVTINRFGTLILGYNPHWMASLKQIWRLGVIKHELLHLIFRHLTARRPRGKKLKLWNIATDLAINSIVGIDNLPPNVFFPGKPLGPKSDPEFSKFIENLEPHLASEAYLNALMQFKEEWQKNNPDNPDNDENGDFIFENGFGDTLDDHDKWDEIPEDLQDLFREKMRDIVDKLAKQANTTSSGWGSIPEATRRLIVSSLSSEIDWNTVLAQFLGRARSREETTSIKIINRRFPYIHPGFKRKTRSKVWIFGDQSGSVDDTNLSLFFSTLEKLSKTVDEFVYFPFDTMVYEHEKIIWKKYSKIKKERVATGGTDFDCVANYVNSHRGQCDAVIILTDGYAPQIKPIYGSDVLWIITLNGVVEPALRGHRVIKMSHPREMHRVG